jgi:redox-sensitive bicupin YhaK (pirin superfamily)
MPASLQNPRPVVKVVEGQATSDGAGVRLKRTVGTRGLDHVDPFLLLDEFKSELGSDYLAGFPDHPHRGFETVTYMLAGAMEHRDHRGNHGLLGPGSVQWMTAGKGIIHSEMPRQQEGLMWGFQLWINLPARDKMGPPRYQDIPPERVPEVTAEDGVQVRVLAGEALGRTGPVEGIVTRPLYLDVRLPAGTRFTQPIPSGHSALAYVYEGAARFGGGERVEAGHLAVFGPGDGVEIAADGGPARLLLLAAQPLGEPVARLGPFVMNTREELAQAVHDFQTGTFLS